MLNNKKLYNYNNFFLKDLREPTSEQQYSKLSNFEKKKI